MRPTINEIEQSYYQATLEARLRLGLKPLANPIPGRPEYSIPVPRFLLKINAATQAQVNAGERGHPEFPYSGSVDAQTTGDCQQAGYKPALAAPYSGKCVECKQETEDVHDGDFLHDGCFEQLVAEQREDDRLNDPRHA